MTKTKSVINRDSKSLLYQIVLRPRKSEEGIFEKIIDWNFN